MKFIVILTIPLLLGCDKPVPDSSKDYNAISCDKYGCILLSHFKSYDVCQDFIHSIVNLHIKEKQDRIIGCVEI